MQVASDYAVHTAACFTRCAELSYGLLSCPLSANAKVLDVASGTGNTVFALLASSPSAHITATDISSGMLKELKVNLARRDLSSANVETKLASMTDLSSFPANRWGGALSCVCCVCVTVCDHILFHVWCVSYVCSYVCGMCVHMCVHMCVVWVLWWVGVCIKSLNLLTSHTAMLVSLLHQSEWPVDLACIRT